jgi:uncharacterized protein YdcH (DUF465 family)
MKYLHHLKYKLFVVRHKLDEEIQREHALRRPDVERLSRLKKLRLAVKDRLAGHLKLLPTT